MSLLLPSNVGILNYVIELRSFVYHLNRSAIGHERRSFRCFGEHAEPDCNDILRAAAGYLTSSRWHDRRGGGPASHEYSVGGALCRRWTRASAREPCSSKTTSAPRPGWHRVRRAVRLAWKKNGSPKKPL